MQFQGPKALEITKQYKIDLILLDIEMPIMNGYEVCKELKTDEKTRDTPIIFVTAKDSEQDEEHGFKLGAVDYIAKPFKPITILARVDTHLKLKILNDSLKSEVEREIAKREHQEQILIQQSRLAAMGEMISAIAHQWRQPLNVIGLVIQNARLIYNRGKMDSDGFDKIVEKIMLQVNYMSKTIDDFRNFFKPNKLKDLFNPKDSILEVFNIVSAQLKHHYIEIKLKCDSFDNSIYGYESEFKQVLLNIINNAKDSIIEKQKTQNYVGEIVVELIQKNEEIIITIIDNGIGISDEVLKHIFEPYFSTKDASGTGIGLYMSKIIIEEHMQGKIIAKNLENGAEFIVKLKGEVK